MTGTFLRAIDISSGPMELMGENETPKGFFCNTTICKTHTGRSFWAWRSARKQTRAFTGLKKENTLTIFLPLGNQIKLLFGIRCVISNRFGRREHKFKLFISSELFLIINIVHRLKYQSFRVLCKESPVEKRGKQSLYSSCCRAT